MSARIRIKSLKGDQKAEAYLTNAKIYLESHGAPAELISTLEQLYRSALEKNIPSKLTQSEKLALLAVKYFASPGGTGADVHTQTKLARYVQTWLKRSGKDIKGVDTPEALEAEQLLKTLSKKKRWDVILGMLNGTVTLAQAKEEAQKRKTRERKAEAGTKPRKRSKKAKEEAPATPAPAPAPEVTATHKEKTEVTVAPETAPAPEVIEETPEEKTEIVEVPVEEKPAEEKTASGGEEEASKEAEAVAEQILAEGLV
ncbi:MAG: hypothetical protein JHC26_01410 [Thermofilum sp.]|jgi:hypothetical protein|uniref:hypothetical protein n=1 Tax=Thermofilum sp. TaxID=1961369 RepID=UPI00258CC10B|nr:hypothetical protein [Thermofilum sp.]MCI4407718.1 hypothetical protein [Thermofilum sp.]